MSVFEVLAKTDDTADRNAARAAIAAQERARARFGRFVANASGEGEAESRRALVDDEIRAIAQAAADEYDGDAETAYLAATAVLGGGHASDCSCGFCANKGKLPGAKKDDDKDDSDKDDSKDEDDKDDDSGKPWEKDSAKTACEGCGCGSEKCSCTKADPCGKDGCKYAKKEARWAVVSAAPETGDSYQSETVSLPTADDSGLGSEGSPKIDKGKSGDNAGWSLEPIDVGSKRHQLENQDASARADYNSDDFDPSSPVRDRVDADSPIGGRSELESADGTKTWTGTGGQADPVTTESLNQVAARYQVVETKE